MKTANLIPNKKIVLGNVICLVLTFFANTTFAEQLPALPASEDSVPLSISQTAETDKKEQSFGQWFKGAIGLGEEEEEEEKKAEEQANIQDAIASDIPDLPSVSQLTTEQQNLNNKDEDRRLSLNNNISLKADIPGKGETLLDREFNIRKDLDIDELFKEFADDARNLSDGTQTPDSSPVQNSQQLPPLKVSPPAAKEQIKENSIVKPNNLPDPKIETANENNADLQIPDFEKLLDQTQGNSQKSAISNEENITANEIKTTATPTLESLPDIPEVQASSSYTEAELSEEDKPVVANQVTQDEQQDRIANFRDTIKRKLSSGGDNLPKLSNKQLKRSNAEDDSILSQEIGNKQLRFVNNEAQVLKLPNDDIVLGKLTEEAKIEAMDFNSYIKFFWKNYERIKEEEPRKSIEQFVKNYDDNFNSERYLFAEENDYDGLARANKAISYDRYNDLKVLLDNYTILQLDGINGNTLLHHAAREGNYPAAKLLVIRGTNMKATNARGESAMVIAKRYNHKHIVYLLNRAGYHNDL